MNLAHGWTILHGDDWTHFGAALLVAFAILVTLAVVKIRQRSK